ncbi:hypothetical protein PsYK624_165050 [Phanerochaete sordida]|uniref:BTB domain-containing protein n=1 Tax=Phanerochaete sordida TaxID=48140 RepID=A0A9P3LN34_9APHY|nr:hypothetical protein PsYK624_165050 [Phanerochaete sordida]
MSTPLHALAKVPSGGSLTDALAEALAGKPFNDVVFLAPVRVGEGARHAVYANSGILCAESAYFRELLSEEGAAVSTVDAPPRASAQSYTGSVSESESSLGAEDDIDALESLLATPSEVSFSPDEKTKVFEALAEDTTSAETSFSPPSGARIVTLDQVSADTLEAVVFYIYTGEIYFLPLRSQGTESSAEARSAHALVHPNRPIASCKAVYRFADMANLAPLKQLADAHLFSALSSTNILAEVFSPFSSEHPSILRRQSALLLEHYWTPATRAAQRPLVARIVRGEMLHAGPALSMLLDEIAPVAAPANTRPRGLAPAEPAHTGRSAPNPPPALPPSGGCPQTQAEAPARHPEYAPSPQASAAGTSALTSAGAQAAPATTCAPAPLAEEPPKTPEDGALGACAEQSTAARLGALLAQKAAERAREAQLEAHVSEAQKTDAQAAEVQGHEAQTTPLQDATAAHTFGAHPDAQTSAPTSRSSTWWRDALRSAVVDVDVDEASMHPPTDGSEWSGVSAYDVAYECWDGWGDESLVQTAAPSQSSSTAWRAAVVSVGVDEAGTHPAGEREDEAGATRPAEDASLVQASGAQAAAGQAAMAPPKGSTSWRDTLRSAVVNDEGEVRTHAPDGGESSAAAAVPQLERRGTVPDAPPAFAGGEDARWTTQERRGAADLGHGLSKSKKKALRKEARRAPAAAAAGRGAGVAVDTLLAGAAGGAVVEGGAARRADG